MEGSARLFFAAWPAPEIQRALGDLGSAIQHHCGGKALPARNIHLTLVFLGNVARERLTQLEKLAAAISSPRFDLEVDRIEYWQHNRIVWVGVTRCPGALSMLVERLELGLTSAGFCIDSRPYAPHVTLLRNARCAPPAGEMRAVAWPVTRFALVESVRRERGRDYECLRVWDLGGA